MIYTCALCKREVSLITLHHLIPKEEGGTFSGKIHLCQPCHTTIHDTYSNKELAKEYNTVEKLAEAGKLQKYLRWIRKQKVEKIRNR